MGSSGGGKIRAGGKSGGNIGGKSAQRILETRRQEDLSVPKTQLLQLETIGGIILTRKPLPRSAYSEEVFVPIMNNIPKGYGGLGRCQGDTRGILGLHQGWIIYKCMPAVPAVFVESMHLSILVVRNPHSP